jgi:lysophospholipase L1-like esterase
MRKFKTGLSKLLLGKLWTQWQTGIEAAATPGSGGIVLLGDSITHNARWDLMFPGAGIQNFGISGYRTDQLFALVAPIVNVRPRKLFLLIGTNDLAIGASIDEIVGNVAKLFDQLRSALPECTFYLQTVMPRKRKFATRIAELNQRYTTLAAQRDIEVIDLFPLFDDSTGQMRADLTNDDLHLIGAGYQVWRRKLVAYLG